MIKISTEDMTCIDSYKCSDLYVSKLEKLTNKKYHKTKLSDPKPDGSVSILHTQHKHIITTETYD